jgi:DNA repair exonuclease SbcCD nuclease subunit
LLDCLNIGVEEKVDAIVLLGDLFDVREVSPEARNLTLQTLKCQPSGKAWPFPIYITVGNHDIASSYPLDKSSLGTLISAGVLLKEDYVPELSIAFAHYEPDLDSDILNGKLANHPALIWSCHASIGNQVDRFEEYMILFDDIPVHPNNMLVISGHIHHPMKCFRKDGKKFVNPGAIGRTAATKDNLNRLLKVYLLEYDLDGNIHNEKYILLPSAKSFEEVFKIEEIQNKKAHKEDVRDFVKSISVMKANNWYYLHTEDKVKVLKSDGKKDDLNDMIIDIAINAFVEVRSELDKEES